MACLDENEIARYHRHQRKPQQAMFVTGRLLSKHLLSRYLGCSEKQVVFTYSRNGKPTLADKSPLFFSLSHSGNNVLVAVSNHNVGADLELHAGLTSLIETPAQYLNSAIGEQLITVNRHQRLPLAAQYWTMLEALVKLKDSSVFKLRNKLTKQQTHITFPSESVVLNTKLSQHQLAPNIIASTVSDKLDCRFNYYRLAFM
jgi:phosphopantetheinyl transferase